MKVTQRFALSTLDEEVSGSIPAEINLENEFYLFSTGLNVPGRAPE